jgi:F-type H+-transporting ATPase subunit delta
MVAAFFDNPQVPNARKRDTVAQLLGPEGQQLTRNFAGLLIERGRFGAIRQVYNAYHDQVLARQGIAVGDVTTAVPLNDAELAVVRDRLSTIVGKHVEVRATVDPSIIGGIIARVDDQLIDGSVTNQLRKLRERLVARR